ncbi:SDR family NAD(P)-dependent oxidoreductase [Micromonospora terminaliae]|uniref:SDR family NAD(P)-dependent oxidoreductase n=1 Tax=Micromonospora terminaliae TaxID=1914461 RepID=A0AAJ3DIL3_9ACTN|nr:oxidoreductase [Micromonospora terminaliae]NES27919.1 SDR family NAD(P)-dependent oxidoreductase [Micromonospora terminaliae]QGL47310.1 SDR family NAD(P)-dependent oxidoreductase [Micromonospora terminaliae]
MTTVLITGTSSGIGRATVRRLARRPGLTVYATARKLDAITDLADTGARLLPLDVTDEDSMRTAVAAVEAAHGHVDVLVNNAGYGEYGPIEETPLDRVRAQFETNVFGLARLTQLVLPGMRRAGRGRIINVSSMGGRLVFPGGGYYHSSKYAVEAISDALRQEVRPFGVDVAIVEPGLIRTGFGAVASSSLGAGADPSGPYREMVTTVDTVMARSYENKLLSATPDTVARVIERAVTARRPRTRYLVTAAASAMVHTRRLLGARVFDAVNRLQFR